MDFLASVISFTFSDHLSTVVTGLFSAHKNLYVGSTSCFQISFHLELILILQMSEENLHLRIYIYLSTFFAQQCFVHKLHNKYSAFDKVVLYSLQFNIL